MSDDPQESAVPLAEISQGPNAFEEFLDRNQKSIILLAILLAIGTAAVVIYRGIEKNRQETAGAAFNKAADLATLQTVIKEHPDTHAAQSATVLLADQQWNADQKDEAIETLRSFISSSPDHPALPAAQASLGAKLMAQGKSADAAGIFQDLADDPKARYIAPYALICLGDIAKVGGDAEKAEAFYNRVKADFSDSSFVANATSRISALKAKPPVEIEPPPAPKMETPAAPGAPGAIVAPPAIPPVPQPAPVAPAAEPAPAAPVDDAPPAAAPPVESIPQGSDERNAAEPTSNP